VHNSDDILDADAAAANRRDVRRTVVITAISLALVLVTSTLVVLGGSPA
jgi:hypothetical protein